MIETLPFKLSYTQIKSTAELLQEVALCTPLQKNLTYSRKFSCNVWFKREDLQQVRSYKIRGAYNRMSSLEPEQFKAGIVCASAGNHAQGVAFSCAKLGIPGSIYMPTPTPQQKVEQVRMFGEGAVTIKLIGDTYDEAYQAAMLECAEKGKVFIHPFDDEKVIEGQATVGLELWEQSKEPLDYVFVPVGGGGLASGLAALFHELSPATRIIGVEPAGAPAMKAALDAGKIVTLKEIDNFVDGAAVKVVGAKTFLLCKEYLSEVVLVPEGKVCQTILDLYNKEAIVVEPAGVLSVAALDQFADEIRGKNVACIISGSNNDIIRTPEIKERALLYSKLKHYFIIRFPQRAGALREFVNDILGPDDDITYFQYSNKHNRERGPAVVGLELKDPQRLEPLVDKMKEKGFYGDYLNDKPDLFQFLI